MPYENPLEWARISVIREAVEAATWTAWLSEVPLTWLETDFPTTYFGALR